MSCFALRDLSFHRVVFAHVLAVENYHFSFSTAGFGAYYPARDEHSGLLEIGYVVRNPLVVDNHTTGERYTVEEGDMFLFPPGHNITVRAQNPGEHKHITSEYMLDATVSRWDEGEETDTTLVLPYVIRAEKASRSAKNIIHRVAADYSLLADKSYFAQAADFFALLEGLRRSGDPRVGEKPYFSPVSKAHCKKAEEYIEAHILEPISIQDIADAVELNKNYLINIFSVYKGMGPAEYINRVKLNRILLLVSHYGYTLRQACEYVGYTDPNYISRLFRKYYGVSFTDYCYNLKINEPT